MDVTQTDLFPKKPYLHVVVDTYSRFIWAIPMSSQKSKAVCSFLLQYFSVMGVPYSIKTDNGLSYISKTFEFFCKEWQIKHLKGIPHNCQGQGPQNTKDSITKE